jgi:hypothetical protein
MFPENGDDFPAYRAGPLTIEIPDRSQLRQAWRKVRAKRFPQRPKRRWKRFIIWAH